ncbi:hypothetical protein [Streptomyces sp. NRRL F-2799]|uniref:hypothetical protein n=1 Tax=Streptomyces sp. NRRL F-2799 TaxID=1463844 RepID=UPI00131A57C9|nr:hypothetical protein [Streptomyces sp. NRRL F-2799]
MTVGGGVPPGLDALPPSTAELYLDLHRHPELSGAEEHGRPGHGRAGPTGPGREVTPMRVARITNRMPDGTGGARSRPVG